MPSPFRVGLNPYGLTYTLGLQGLGTPRANPQATGLEGFISLAGAIGARTLEVDLRWLTDLDDEALGRLASEAAAGGMTIVCSTWLLHEPGETLATARRIAARLGGALIRMHLAPVLDRAAAGLSPIEWAILAIGAWELEHRPEIPYRVVINEAVELAKRFGTAESSAFVNGVLDRIAANLGRRADGEPASEPEAT